MEGISRKGEIKMAEEPRDQRDQDRNEGSTADEIEIVELDERLEFGVALFDELEPDDGNGICLNFGDCECSSDSVCC